MTVYDKWEMMRIIIKCKDCEDSGLMCPKHKKDFQDSAKASAEQKVNELWSEVAKKHTDFLAKQLASKSRLTKLPYLLSRVSHLMYFELKKPSCLTQSGT